MALVQRVDFDKMSCQVELQGLVNQYISHNNIQIETYIYR